MAEFAFHAVDPQGRERRGRIAALDAAAARQRLSDRHLHVVACDPAPAAVASTRSLRLPSRAPRLSAKELTLFTRQLASLISVSPLDEALRITARQSERPHVRKILDEVHAGVIEGQRLSEAMRREQRSFPPLYRAMIAAGEGSGTLAHIAARLASLLERQAAMRSKLIGALAYPLVLTAVAILVVVGLMVSVVPRVVEQFEGVDQQLPLLTRIVIGLSDFLARWWWVLALLLALAVLAFARGLKNVDFRRSVDARLLALPFIGRLIRNLHAARMARTLSTMIASRLPLLEGLRLTAATVHNRVLADATEGIVESVRGGGSLSGAMRTSGVFPPILVHLAASGESAGALDTLLERAADYLEREFDEFTATALALLEPAIIVVMGGIVALIILSILLPILQLQSLAGG